VNSSGNARLADLVARRLSRRAVLRGGVGTAVALAFGRPFRANGQELLGFTAVPVSTVSRL
jgi:hypothetical protein